MQKRIWSYALVVIVTIVLSETFHPLAVVNTAAQGECQTFPETGKTACGRFLDYWRSHGGLAQQGYPISAEFTEVSELNGQSYTVQYFERAVFEKHPENAAPNDVLLSQLGTFQFKRKYPSGDPSGGQVPPPQPPAPTQPPQPPSNGVRIELTGHGNQVTQNFQLKAGALRVQAQCTTCESNFIARLVDANSGSTVAYLVNVIGPEPTSDIENVRTAGTYTVQVSADGDWRIVLEQQ
jgi:hypothetical protein